MAIKKDGPKQKTKQASGKTEESSATKQAIEATSPRQKGEAGFPIVGIGSSAGGLEDLTGTTTSIDNLNKEITQRNKAEDERKQAEEQLRKSDEKYRVLVENATDSIFMIDKDDRVLSVNKSATRIFRKEAGELVGKSIRDLFPQEVAAGFSKSLKQVFGKGARRTIESIMRVGEKECWISTSLDPVRSHDHEVVAVMGVTRDITERKQAEEALRSSEAWLSTTLKSIGDAVISTDTKGYVTLINPVAQTLTGWDEKNAIGEPLTDVFNIINEQTGELVENPIARVIREGVVVGLANHTALIAKDGTKRSIDDSGAPIRDEKGNIIGTILVFRDVTEHRKIERNLNERVKELDCLYEIANIAERPGITLDEMYQETIELLPQGLQYPEVACAHLTIDGKEFKTANYRETKWKQSTDIKVHGKKAGTVSVGYLEERPASDEGPFLKEERLLISAIAERLGRITERIQAEKETRESEEKFRSIVENSSDWIFILNRDCKFLSINKTVADLFQKSPQELIGMSIFEIFPEDTAVGYSKNIKNVFYTGKVLHIEEKMLVQGHELYISTSLNPIRDDRGDVIAVTGIVRDITESKKAEEALRESEERYRTLYESAAEGILIGDVETKKLTYANPAICKMLGYSEEELTKMSVADIHPKTSLELVFAEFDAQARGEKKYSPSLPCLKKDGTIIYADINGAKAIINKRECSIGFFNDVTERNKAEERIRVFSSAVAGAIDGITITDMKGTITYANPSMEELFGYEKDGMLGKSVIALATNQEMANGIVSTLIKSGTWGGEVELIKKNKEAFSALLSLSTVRDEKGNPIALMGAIRDITERKQVERTLQQSEEKWYSLVENVPYIIMLVDHDRTIQFINHVVVGLDVKDVIGRSIYDYIQPESHDIAREIVNRVFETGEPGYYEINGVGPDGRMSWYETRTGAIKIDEEVVSVVQITSDITERKQAEEKIMASLVEKETLLKEVHHRVKNNMQVISSLLRLQAGKVKDKDVVAMLKDSQNRIQSMALVYNKLYQSQNLASIDMADYIKELTAGLIKSYTTGSSRVTASIDPSDVFLGVDMAIPCGLVINELVTNSLKYAFPESRTGQIAISLKENGHQELELVVSDNGVGIPESLNLANTSTLGLKLVTNLVESQLDGKIELDRTQGTRFSITFPGPKEVK